MKGDVHNLRRRFDARGAWIVVPAAAAILVAVGVTAPAAVEFASLHASAERAESDAQECVRLNESVSAFKGAGGSQRTRAALAAATRVLPNNCSTVEIHSAVRLAAAQSGWRLTLLNVSEPCSLDLSLSGDQLARRNVEVSGIASFSGLSRLVRALATHGYPARVLTLSLTRDNSTVAGFETHATLALFHNIPPQPQDSAPAAGASEGQGN